MAYDDSDVIKENHTYTDLLEITPSKQKPDEFIIQWQGGSKETYVCGHRNYLISSMLRSVEINKKVKSIKVKGFQLTRAGQVNNSIILTIINLNEIEIRMCSWSRNCFN